MTNRPALFLDRDGTLIIDKNYPRNPDEVEIMPGAADFLEKMTAQGFALVVVSNQSGIGRGIIKPAEAEAVHQRFTAEFKKRGVEFDGAYHCPHAPEDPCECRKPKPGMLLKAASELGLDLSRSFMIGDKLADVAAGQNAGCKGILFRQKAGDKPDDTVPDADSQTWQDVQNYIDICLTRAK